MVNSTVDDHFQVPEVQSTLPEEAPSQVDFPSNKVFSLVLGFLILAYLLPLLTNSHLPMQDIPNHLAVVATLAREQPSPVWTNNFLSRLGLRPYSAYYAVTLGLARLVGVDAANKLVIAIYVAAFPLSFLFLLASVAPGTRWPALLVFPLIYNDAYLVGFVNFFLAIPVVLFASGLAVRAVRPEKPNAGRLLAVALLGVLLYLMHPLSMGIAFGMVILLSLFGTRHRKTLVWLGWALVPWLGLSVYFIFTGGAGGGDPLWLPISFKAQYLALAPLIFVHGLSSPLFLACTLLFVIALGTAIVSWLLAQKEEDSPIGRSIWRNHPALPALLVFLVGFVVLPFGLGSTIWLDARISLFVWLLLFLVLAKNLAAHRIGILAIVALAMVVLVGVLVGHSRFDHEIKPLFEVIDELPPDSRVLPIVLVSDSNAIQPFYQRNQTIPWFSLYTHFGSYYHLSKGGVSPFMTFHPSLRWMPLELKDPFYEANFGIGSPFDPIGILNRLPALASHFDVILVRGENREALRWIERFATPVASSGDFHSFDVRQ